MKLSRILTAVLVLALFGSACTNRGQALPEASTPTALPDMTRAADVARKVHDRSIKVDPSHSGMQSYLLHAAMRQDARSFGPAVDTIRAKFSSPVRIHGVSASVDLSAELFELEAGINKELYGGNTTGWLFHFTSQASQPIDETVMYPQPFHVTTDDYLALVAWIYNATSTEAIAQPEVIIFYTAA